MPALQRGVRGRVRRELRRRRGDPMLFDEFADAGDEHLDPTYVAAYDRKAGTDPSEDVTLLRALGLGPQSTLADLGPGTGTFAFPRAPLCGRACGVAVAR